MPPRAGSRRPDGASGPRRDAGPTQDLARRAAFDLLRAVATRDAYANLVLPGMLRERGIAGRDAAFATELAYGTLRGLGTYDDILAACSHRSLESLDPGARDVLRLGAHQLLAMRTPVHAAVSETVALCRNAVGHSAAGFANAVLRRVAETSLEAWTERLAPDREVDPAGYLTFRHAHPRWIVAAIAETLGGDWDEVDAALAANNVPAAVTLVARPGRSTLEELVAAGATATGLSPYAATWSGDPAALAQIRSGDAGVQDEGSQLVALALAATPIDGPDALWLDACAGPGGKAALLAGLAAQRGAKLLAAEIAPHRANLVAGSLPPGAVAVVADGTRPAWRAGAFDRILVDAPCTGLGALRRRPEARWRREPGDVGRLFDLQTRLLTNALESVRVGGVVGYVTCSPHLGETRGPVLAATKDAGRRGISVEQVDARAALPGVAHLGAGPEIQLWPHRHGTDGMFLALLRRAH
ncbi:MAG: RsmB/NOP family class I SAM-dependent RNA methyltransferase [Sporichthyaceae bacterium]